MPLEKKFWRRTIDETAGIFPERSTQRLTVRKSSRRRS